MPESFWNFDSPPSWVPKYTDASKLAEADAAIANMIAQLSGDWNELELRNLSETEKTTLASLRRSGLTEEEWHYQLLYGNRSPASVRITLSGNVSKKLLLDRLEQDDSEWQEYHRSSVFKIRLSAAGIAAKSDLNGNDKTLAEHVLCCVRGFASNPVGVVAEPVIRTQFTSPEEQTKQTNQPPGKKRPKCNTVIIETIQSNPESCGWSLRRWASEIGYSESTIQGTPTWKAHLAPQRERSKAEKAMQRNRRPKHN
ncbi:hypothetical protein [Aeoliella mucimassa]|uniref:Uncharacterized protein n=1 Tax=Aeoliella mucimassa TaxID=2527972 RepID=A0A518ALU9_9BACT|nr:hypothetical protein [Aeoliella mucimassa]QDU55691.1 hypothetical protein Pan181_18850 [Aeoliella mucimassa]